MKEIDESTAEALVVGAARGAAALKAAPGVSPARKTAGVEPRANLAAALRRARIETAEQSTVVADLRGAEIARLDLLREALEPVLAQVPADCDLFDVAISPGERPRLFVDALGFIEMGRDRRAYRFLQDTRHGRVTIGETEKAEDMVEAVTAYIAHRLIEREKALAVDFASGGGARVSAAQALAASAPPAAPVAPVETSAPRSPGLLYRAYLLLVELCAALIFFGLAAAIGRHVYNAFFL